MVPIAATKPKVATTSDTKSKAEADPRFIPRAESRFTAGSSASVMNVATNSSKAIELNF